MITLIQYMCLFLYDKNINSFIYIIILTLIHKAASERVNKTKLKIYCFKKPSVHFMNLCVT